MKIEWQDSLSVGVPEIDHQHKLLFGKFNALLGAWLDGRGADEVRQLFKFLDLYIVSHFADEERLMQALEYPDYHKHRELHQAFTRQVAGFEERLVSEGPSKELITAISMTMTGWLIKHISGVDRAVGRFMEGKTKGGEEPARHLRA